MVQDSSPISFFSCSCPVFPTPLIEETVLSPLKMIFCFYHAFYIFYIHQLEFDCEAEFHKYFLNVCSVRELGHGISLASVLLGVIAGQSSSYWLFDHHRSSCRERRRVSTAWALCCSSFIFFFLLFLTPKHPPSSPSNCSTSLSHSKY